MFIFLSYKSMKNEYHNSSLNTLMEISQVYKMYGIVLRPLNSRDKGCLCVDAKNNRGRVMTWCLSCPVSLTRSPRGWGEFFFLSTPESSVSFDKMSVTAEEVVVGRVDLCQLHHSYWLLAHFFSFLQWSG